MKLFPKSKPGAPAPAGATPPYQPIDRVNLLGLLDRVVNQGESCVLRLREPRGAWTYAFQGGGSCMRAAAQCAEHARPLTCSGNFSRARSACPPGSTPPSALTFTSTKPACRTC